MSGRRGRSLSPEESALWQRVIASVKPLMPPRSRAAGATIPAMAVAQDETVAPPPAKRPRGRIPDPQPPRVTGEVRADPPAATLDGGWDRRLSRGLVSPESSIDLHGHTLASAYDRLDHGLEQAIRRGDRVLLLITGKPPRPESERPHARGAIRAAVGDWLAASRHADRIAAVRGAHPRHGGNGALYIVLRRQRPPKP